VAPRKNVTHQENYFRAAVNFDTYQVDTAGKVPLGTLPAGAIVTNCIIKIVTAFNAATTNVLSIGTASDASAVLGAADVDETVAGTTMAAAAVGYMPSVDTPLFIKYAQTGTAASAGRAVVVMTFAPNNDR
jgi:hypothetical protein